MKLTETQKAKIRKEVENEKYPRVLVFEKEIQKKKNQNKTIEEIMQMVEDSKTAAKNFIFDNEERFNKRLAELKIQELDKVRIKFNKTHNTDFSLKTFKRFNGVIDDFDELTSFLDEFINLVNINDRTVNKNWRIWGELKEAINTNNWRKACRALRKVIPNITFKQFILQNKNLTVNQAKEQFEELMTPVPEPTFYEFTMEQMNIIFAKITDKPQEFSNFIIQKSLKRELTKETYAIENDIDKIVIFGNAIFNALIKN